MRRLIPVIAIGILFVLAVIYLPGISKYLKLKQKEQALDQEISALEAKVKVLEADELLLKTDITRLEEVVRQELGLVRPGEIVLKIVEEEAPV